ncbi:hypothetical protein AB6A40_011016 [Gnathostoma spinigerum]|uniref:G-protein coupled receptors family 1 profile domain-containing protein n=1 Tax=Gnathostoma spinigerum TaxID=75299 RepID=A0ABD6F3T3_9BILA
MPLSLLDFLHNHMWPFSRALCSVWATSDVLLCTASILNLCVISLDRYMAITSPLRYPRTRSHKVAVGLLGSVWLLSVIVCCPPWFVPEWNLFIHNIDNQIPDKMNDSVRQETDLPRSSAQFFACKYSPSIPYRIYSALCSFYIPLLVMLFVYFKIFRVASQREATTHNSVQSQNRPRMSNGTCRSSTYCCGHDSRPDSR